MKYISRAGKVYLAGAIVLFRDVHDYTVDAWGEGEKLRIEEEENRRESIDSELGPFSSIFANRACGTERTQWTPLFRFEVLIYVCFDMMFSCCKLDKK